MSVNTFGRLPQDRPDQVKLYGSYRVDRESDALGHRSETSPGTPTDATTDPFGGSTPFLGRDLPPSARAPRVEPVHNESRPRESPYDVRDSKRIKLTFMADVFNVLNEQKALRVDSQFLAAGLWRGAILRSALGLRLCRTEGRGEPYDRYVDVAFGNSDGTLTSDEWNRWAGSFEGDSSRPTSSISS